MFDFTNENVFLVSDTHFNHNKLVKSYPDHFDQVRKYDTTQQMDADVITMWNKTITDNDIVIFMGDFMMCVPGDDRYKNVFHSYFDKLNKGKQFYWIKGNHDEKLHQRIPEIEMLDNMQFVKGDKIYYVQHHDYGEVHDKMPNDINSNVVFVHGHTHQETSLSRFDYKGNNYIQNCVCWDAWYRPVNANELEVCG